MDLTCRLLRLGFPDSLVRFPLTDDADEEAGLTVPQNSTSLIGAVRALQPKTSPKSPSDSEGDLELGSAFQAAISSASGPRRVESKS